MRLIGARFTSRAGSKSRAVAVPTDRQPKRDHYASVVSNAMARRGRVAFPVMIPPTRYP